MEAGCLLAGLLHRRSSSFPYSSAVRLFRGSQYRAGLFLHHDPSYSFKVPDGCRRAGREDVENFAYNRRVLQRFNAQGRSATIASWQNEIRRYDAVLISARGGYIQVDHAANNSGVSFASGYVLNDREKDAIWSEMSRAFVASAPANDKPKLTLIFMAVSSYGNNTTLLVRLLSSVQRGELRP